MRTDPPLYMGDSPFWVDLRRRIQAYAPTPWPVLLLGPTGSGKSALARVIHDASGRQGELVECALPTVADSLRHSALFGHDRGAFTDASHDHAGALEQAHGGTLFLDEMALASLDTQQVLLVALEQRWVRRVGGVRKIPVDARFLFATSADLAALVRAGRFLEELVWRLGGLKITLPGLAERREDILPLAERFLGELLAEARKSWRARFTPEVALLLRQHPWPGNIRELRNVCQHAAAVLDTDRPVELGDLPSELTHPPAERATSPSSAALLQAQLRVTLANTGGNKSEAARRLEMSRQRLHRLLQKQPRHTPSGGHSRPA